MKPVAFCPDLSLHRLRPPGTCRARCAEALCRQCAAAFCAISVSTFDDFVRPALPFIAIGSKQVIKNKKAITIDLTPRAAEVRKEEIDELNAARKADGKEPLKLDEAIFGKFDFHQARTRKRKREGKLVDVVDGGVFGRACRIAGIDPHGLTPHHVTRHTAATLAAGKPSATLAGLMARGAPPPSPKSTCTRI